MNKRTLNKRLKFINEIENILIENNAHIYQIIFENETYDELFGHKVGYVVNVWGTKHGRDIELVRKENKK